MKIPLFLKNIPIDEKRISWIETVVSRLARRSRKQTTVIVTPYPISNCVSGEDVKGDILKYMFCAKGTISKGLIVLDKRPATGVVIGITLANDMGGSSHSYVLTKKTSMIDPKVEVFSGDRLSVSVNPIDAEKDKVSEVWLSFMWTPDVKDTTMKQVLIDSLDEALDVPEE